MPKRLCPYLSWFRRYYLFLLVFVLPLGSFAQKEVEKVKTYLKANAEKYQLSENDINEMDISSAYLSPTTGWYHVYFIQKHQSIEVYNGILNTVLVNDEVANANTTFIDHIDVRAPSSLVALRLSPLEAVSRAASGINMPVNINLSEQKNVIHLANGQISKAVYTNADLSKEDINVKLYWFRHDSVSTSEKNLASVKLVWNVQIYTKDYKNYWSVQVDAQTGNVLNIEDMVIHCDFGTPDHMKAPHVCNDSHENTAVTELFGNFLNPVAANSYRVFDYPIESPNHGARTLVASPYTKFVPSGTGPGATNGWHHDGTTSFTNTRGNNVWAKDDIAGDNESTIGGNPVSATLEFDYAYTQATGTAAANRNAAITNLFYWNNVIHDVLWKYGFDEPSGNFQKNNMSRGGLGNDFVFADAQDGSGTNNANFATPPDGSNPRMQMFLFSNAGSPLYQPDSDFDNGVLTHEYGHGWSNRLTAGPAVTTCLTNSEQGGEGWSDFLALMLTTNWGSLSPNVASANLSRGMGTYVMGQSTSGGGIRNYPYSYNLAVNGAVTYGKVASYSIPHGVGSIWATMLWDMTWEIIMQDNAIVSNIYNTSSLVGNVAALKLVNEGLRLQPCSPSFIDARDAILKADQLLFNGRYSCSIWKAFARRGLGFYASTGVSPNDRVVTEDYNIGPNRVLTSPVKLSVCSNSTFAYTATTSATGTTTFSWSRPAVAGISNAAASGNTATINEVLVNTTTNPIVVTYVFNLTPNSCNATTWPQRVLVTVNPLPVATVASYGICKDGTVPSGQGLSVSNNPSTIANGVLTSNSPMYNRGMNDGNSTVYTPIGLAEFYYATHTFVAPASGSVSFEIINGTFYESWSNADSYMSLYQTSFNPNSPATNFLRGDDDSGAMYYTSKITHNLVAGTTYVIVVTSYSVRKTGTYILQATTPLFTNTISWYNSAAGGSPFFGGNVLNPVGVAGSGIANTATPIVKPYYVESSANPGCRIPTTFTIHATTVGGNVSGTTTVCSTTNSGTLTLVGHTGSVLRWESSTDNFVSVVTTIANTTTTLSYSNLAQTTKYRAVVKSGTCAQAYSGVATITKSTPSSPPSGVAGSRCGAGTVTLMATGCAGGVINWFTGATGGTVIATGGTYVTPSIPTTTTYYANCLLNGCFSNRVPVVATVNAIPAVPTLSAGNRCGPGQVILTASGCAGTVSWFTVATGGSAVATGGTYTTPSISVATTYYASCTVSGCTSARGSVAATIKPIPIAPTAGPATRCGPGTVTLTASGCSGGTISWFTVASGGTAIATGGTYTTPSLSANTTYYVGCTLNGCTSLTRASVLATVNVAPVYSGSQAAGNFRASQSITSTSNVATGVNYYAGKYILLSPGFQAGGNEVFNARIANCP